MHKIKFLGRCSEVYQIKYKNDFLKICRFINFDYIIASKNSKFNLKNRILFNGIVLNSYLIFFELILLNDKNKIKFILRDIFMYNFVDNFEKNNNILQA